MSRFFFLLVTFTILLMIIFFHSCYNWLPPAVAALHESKKTMDLSELYCELSEGKTVGSKESHMSEKPDKPISQDRYHTLIMKAKEDLAGRLSIDLDQIKLFEVEEVVWPDASLGCPHQQMRYKQIPSDGLLILLSVDNCVYRYHSGGTRDPFLCKNAHRVLRSKPPKLDRFLPKPDKADE